MPPLELNLLGGFDVRLDGHALAGFESDKARLLLAYLAIESGRPHRRESLVGLFWPESSERRARQSLNQALHNLRQVLGPETCDACLAASNQEVTFHTSASVQVDVARFLDLCDEVTAHTHSSTQLSPAWTCRECVRRLGQAIDLYRGDLLSGFSLADADAFEDWLRLMRERLNALAVGGLSELVQASLKRGDLDQAFSYVERLAAMDRFDEANLRQRLSILARKGRRADALQVYLEYERWLADELGTDPEAQTLALFELINHQYETFAAFRQPPNNLPSATARLVGRQEELEDLYWKLVDPDCRLVTILGMGGSGKTRLAMEAGRSLLPAFPDGVFWIELGILSSVHDLLAIVAHILDVKQTPFLETLVQPGMDQKLIEDLRKKELLLILDGAEMVLEGVTVLFNLLRQTASVKILVTSRARLNLQSENLVFLEGLPVPDEFTSGWDRYAAVQLFEDAARRIKPDFLVGGSQAVAVFDICRILKGMPLAILLAAAWTSALPAEQILSEIRSSLDFLVVGWQDIPSRQQSLRAAFDYSWNLLWHEEKTVLQRLAVFRQPFTSEQAAEVAQASALNLKALLDFALLQHADNERFRIHDLVRQFAQEKLNENPREIQEVHERLVSYYLKRLSIWGRELKRNQQMTVLKEMALEIENARLAWDWMSGQGYWAGLERTLDGLCIFYEKRGQAHSGETACAAGLVEIEWRGIDAGTLCLWARLTCWQAYFRIQQGHQEQGLTGLESVLQELGKEMWSEQDVSRELALAWYFKSCLLVRKDNPVTLSCSIQSAEIFEALDEDWYAARALVRAGEALESMSRFAEQLQVSERALKLQSPGGDPELVQYILYVLGCSYLFTGQIEKGSRIILESLDVFQNLDSKIEIIRLSRQKAVSSFWLGKFDEALPLIESILMIYQEMGMPVATIDRTAVIAVNWGLGRFDDVNAYTQKIPASNPDFFTRLFIGSIYLLQGKNGLARQEFALAMTESFPISDRRTFAWAQAFTSIACYREGDGDLSRDCLYQAIQECQVDTTMGASACLLAITYFLLERGEMQQAVETFTTAANFPAFGNSAWTREFLGVRLEQLAQSLPEDVVEAARARGRAQKMHTAALSWLDRIDMFFPPSQDGIG
jgi:DNA-binding SARP family transcriptional activator/predicted ATPase